MLVGMKRDGDFFVSAGVGTEDDFFGFTEDHKDVRALRLTTGHENVFAHVTHLHTSSDGYIEEAVGRSVGATMREELMLTDDTTLNLSARTERFLSGHAGYREIGATMGSVRLNRGGWDHHRLSHHRGCTSHL